ncbi:MAG: hypothetical protein HUU19_06170 [Phycisphaerales bacterium]|nr:hypothetical protein [Phycisphaerales bacterium]
MNSPKHSLLPHVLLALVAPALAQVTPSAPAEPAPRLAQDSAPPKPKKETRDETHQRRMLEEKGAFETRLAAIDAELLLHDREHPFKEDWANAYAGEYSGGDGLGMNLSLKLAPESGVAFRWTSCLGIVDENHAKISKADESGLWLKPAIDPKLIWRSHIDDRMYFVNWRSRRFLVSRSLMIDFCNKCNRGWSDSDLARWFPSAPRTGDIDPAEPPQVPGEYSQFLRASPLQAEAIAVRDLATRDWEPGEITLVTTCVVELNIGNSEGVYKDLMFYSIAGQTNAEITITEVREHTSLGALRLYSRKGERPPQPEKGWRFKSADLE